MGTKVKRHFPLFVNFFVSKRVPTSALTKICKRTIVNAGILKLGHDPPSMSRKGVRALRAPPDLIYVT